MPTSWYSDDNYVDNIEILGSPSKSLFRITFIGKIYRMIYAFLRRAMLVTSGVIRQQFSWVTQLRVKIIGESSHDWPKTRY